MQAMLERRLEKEGFGANRDIMNTRQKAHPADRKRKKGKAQQTEANLTVQKTIQPPCRVPSLQRNPLNSATLPTTTTLQQNYSLNVTQTYIRLIELTFIR